MPEVVSAYATVGLSLGITSSFSIMSKIVLCIVMFIGRVGSITLISIWLKEDQKKHFQKIKDILKAKHKLPKLTSELNTNVNAFQLLTHRFISRK